MYDPEVAAAKRKARAQRREEGAQDDLFGLFEDDMVGVVCFGVCRGVGLGAFFFCVWLLGFDV
jgi:hypothetical protein